MLSTMRNYVLAAGAAALLSGQTVHAAPVQPAPAIDPLVALSLLGTAQSRAAVCGTSATCGLPMATGASTAAASPAVTASAAVAAQQGPSGERQSGLLMVFLIGGVMVLIAVLAATLADNGEDEPISPA